MVAITNVKLIDGSRASEGTYVSSSDRFVILSDDEIMVPCKVHTLPRRERLLMLSDDEMWPPRRAETFL